MTTSVSTVTQVHRVFIKAPIDKVWQAITDTDWNDKYGYLCKAYFDLKPGGEYRVDATPEMLEFRAPEVLITGEIIELDDAPATARQVAGDVENAGGGWPFILSDLKTFLESGAPMNG